MAKAKNRGRIGGYGRTGEFVKIAQFNRWYSTKQIRDHFHQRGDLITLAQAKSVFESIDRGKCYRTKKRVVGSRLAIMLLPELIAIESVPDHLLKICNSSIHSYLSSLILQTAFGTPLCSIKKEFPLNSEELQGLVDLQMQEEPVNIDGRSCSIAGWDLLGDSVRVIFKGVE